MFILRVLILPFSMLYGLFVSLRNKFFDWGIYKSVPHQTKSISVGNITVGGTGKSPHIEYLIEALQNTNKIVTLSRGYKRKTKGYVVANTATTYQEIGDEPMQFHSKFSKIQVVVDENRRRGIANIEKEFSPDLILLDDCYQHRWIKPGLSILLIDYSTIGTKQFMLPSGELREFKSGIKRADIIIISKSPELYSPIEHRRIKEIVQPLSSQSLFFSYITYENLRPFNQAAKQLTKEEGFDVENFKTLVFAGIAKIAPLLDFVQSKAKAVKVVKFNDHQNFTPVHMVKVLNAFNEIISSQKLIITTEKDAMRLKDERLFPLLEEAPVFYLPIKIKFHKNPEGELSFNDSINKYVQKN